MNEDIELYKLQRENIIKYVKKNGLDKVPFFSACTGVPLKVIYTYVMMDMVEHTEVCLNKIKSLNKFYNGK